MKITATVKQIRDKSWIYSIKIEYLAIDRYEEYRSTISYPSSHEAAKDLSKTLKTLEEIHDF